MATSAVASGARSMLRAASSRGRFASQAKSVPPMFRATARRSSLLSPLRYAPIWSLFLLVCIRKIADGKLAIYFWVVWDIFAPLVLYSAVEKDQFQSLLNNDCFDFDWMVGIQWKWASVWSQCYPTTLPQLLRLWLQCFPPLRIATPGSLTVSFLNPHTFFVWPILCFLTTVSVLAF